MNYIIVIGLTWLLIYSFFYSPRAQIKRILKEMFDIPIKLAGVKGKFGDKDKNIYNSCKKSLEIRYKIVIALLDYYFDSKEDKEYIKEKTDYAEAMLNNVDKIFTELDNM